MRVLDLLICDDIRIEVGGKWSFMGVFLDGISISTSGVPLIWPITLARMGIFARVHLEDSDPRPDRYALFAHINSNLVGRYEGTPILAAGSSHISIVHLVQGFQLIAPGDISFAIELTKDDKTVTVEPKHSTRLTVA